MSFDVNGKRRGICGGVRNAEKELRGMTEFNVRRSWLYICIISVDAEYRRK